MWNKILQNFIAPEASKPEEPEPRPKLKRWIWELPQEEPKLKRTPWHKIGSGVTAWYEAEEKQEDKDIKDLSEQIEKLKL